MRYLTAGGKRWSPVFIMALILLMLVAAFFAWRHFEIFKLKKVAQKVQLVKSFSFSSADSLKEWEEKIFKGKVIYLIEKDEGLSYVGAHSKGDDSALYYRIKMEARSRHPIVSWKWRVIKFPDKKQPENLGVKDEDDYAARFYVIFPAMFFTNSKVLEYVWSKDLPVGTTGTSPYSPNIRLIVLRHGPASGKQWYDERRDIYSDYVMMFGRPPEYDIGAIAFMTNSEHTNTSADAMYDDIELGYT